MSRSVLPSRLWLSAAVLVAGVGAQAAGAMAQETPTAISLQEITDEYGLDFVHDSGETPDNYMPEVMGSGVAFLDFDVDGHHDLYLTDGRRLIDPEPGTGANALYRGRVGGFDRVRESGAEDFGVGMGATAVDYDGDGFRDLFVTNFGRNALYRNNGDGTFADVTDRVGAGGDGRWSTGAAWGDLDGDALPDLYVANYLEYDVETRPICGEPLEGRIRTCHPDKFRGSGDLMYQARADGTLARRDDVLGIAASPTGKGLGVTLEDVDGDGRLDVYVANDTTPNFLHLNRGGFRFEESALIMGLAVGENGESQAGMGVDFSDLDGDGGTDLLVTNFATEPYNLYRPFAPGMYAEDSYRLGFGQSTYHHLGFGVVSVDLDGDGDEDVMVVNGHIDDYVEDYAQPNQVFDNRLSELRRRALAENSLEPESGAPEDFFATPGWRPEDGLLEEVSGQLGGITERERVSRGLAYGDVDGDGRPDLVVTNNGEHVELLRNASAPEHSRLVLRLRGRAGERDAVGARVRVLPDPGPEGPTAFPIYLGVGSASSYLSQNAADLYAGLGTATTASVLVRWPSGSIQDLGSLEADHLYLIAEERGVVARRPLAPR